MAADIAQFPERMGTYGVDLMVLHLNGETIDELVDTGTAVVTPETVEHVQSAVRFAAGTKNRNKTLPTMSFKLTGLVGSDPIGPAMTDPTCDPSTTESPGRRDAG